ncbi:Uncharacterised protein [Bacillus subtilis]|nr:hypothetical protein S101392_00196 [Bacillus subtilis subsp. subtilis]CJS85385.1 Uncharacterised protein [Streptococcus pneumoniae]COO40166.1 Uncharacterised protein [Bacillus subtilis]
MEVFTLNRTALTPQEAADFWGFTRKQFISWLEMVRFLISKLERKFSFVLILLMSGSKSRNKTA